MPWHLPRCRSAGSCCIETQEAVARARRSRSDSARRSDDGVTVSTAVPPQLARLQFRFPLLGPAFVAAVASIDPGNFATNIAAVARYGYALDGDARRADRDATDLAEFVGAAVGLNVLFGVRCSDRV